MTQTAQPNPLTDELSDEAKQRLARQFAALRRELDEHEARLARWKVDAVRIADHASQEYPAPIVGLVAYASGHVTKKQDRKNEERKRCQ